MADLIVGLFKDSKKAGEAVSELKDRNFADDISLIAKEKGETKTHQIQQDVTDGTIGGAATGGTIGALAGILAGVATAVVPGFGALIIAGPLAALWGVTGGAIGALAGGLFGALVDAGIPEERARLYEERVKEGDILVSVTADEDDIQTVQDIFKKHNATSMEYRQDNAFA